MATMKLNIARPSAKAPESMALYEKLHQMTSEADSNDSDETGLNEFLGGLFNIVAKLEAQSHED
jgi:hypothetical protein